ncbi:LexA family transcriptional regulator [Streptococcus pluranimalium]|uniref:LexA family transcriptional regulator n=1 Tax=Streptococcus pluranimalium TaxID=82348 RepID=UPI003F68F718
MYQSEKIKKRREELGLKQIQVAEQLGISKQSYFAWEKGKTKPNKKNLEKLEQLLKVEAGYFSEEEIATLYKKLTLPNQSKAMTYVKNLVTKQEKVVSILDEPRFEYHVFEKMSAGVGASIYDNRDYDTVYFTEEIAHDFASWVSGDFMEPKYQDGSVALIRETGFDYDGAVYAVVWNSQTYIKKVYKEKDGLRLVSINTDYADKFAPFDENPRIVGKIVGNFIPLEV